MRNNANQERGYIFRITPEAELVDPEEDDADSVLELVTGNAEDPETTVIRRFR